MDYDFDRDIPCPDCGKPTVRIERMYHRKLVFCRYCEDCEKVFTPSIDCLRCERKEKCSDVIYISYKLAVKDDFDTQDEAYDWIHDGKLYSRFHSDEWRE